MISSHSCLVRLATALILLTSHGSLIPGPPKGVEEGVEKVVIGDIGGERRGSVRGE